MSKPQPFRTCLLDSGIWGWAMVLYSGGTQQQVNDELSRLRLSGSLDISTAIGHCWVEEDYPIVIWTQDHLDIPTLVHELMHGIFGALEVRGLKYSADSEEAYTYTMTHLLRQALVRKNWRRV